MENWSGKMITVELHALKLALPSESYTGVVLDAGHVWLFLLLSNMSAILVIIASTCTIEESVHT